MPSCHVGLIKYQDGRADTRFTYEIATSFFRRLFGLRIPIGSDALLFPRCSCVHGFGVKKDIQVIFLSSEGRVLKVRNRLGAHSIASHPQASHVLEFSTPKSLVIGDQLMLSEGLTRRKPAGFSLVETLLALPILIFALFTLVQIGLLWHARFSLQHAVLVAARHASVSHGSDGAIRDGLVQGLLPLVGRSPAVSGIPESLLRSGAQLAEGLAMGWLRWEVVSPTRQSFQDWGVPADRHLSPSAATGEIEIPSISLSSLALRRLPASGVQHRSAGLPVGVASGQTLIEANLLTLRLHYGVPLNMPVAGQLIARSLALWSGCGWINTREKDKFGLVNYGDGADASLLSQSIQCRSLAARDLTGRWKPRWPVKVYATVTMQSNARRSQMALKDR